MNRVVGYVVGTPLDGIVWAWKQERGTQQMQRVMGRCKQVQ
jgi:hypothetical protein